MRKKTSARIFWIGIQR